MRLSRGRYIQESFLIIHWITYCMLADTLPITSSYQESFLQLDETLEYPLLQSPVSFSCTHWDPLILFGGTGPFSVRPGGNGGESLIVQLWHQKSGVLRGGIGREVGVGVEVLLFVILLLHI